MRGAATTEKARLTEDIDQRREAYIAGINTRRDEESNRMRELAQEDRKGIEAWVAAEHQRIAEERDRRTAALEADLETSLTEHGAQVDGEIERVEAAIAAYRTDVDAYFETLEGDSDPVAIAQHAGRRPVFPDLDKAGAPEEPVVAEADDAVAAASAALTAAVAERVANADVAPAAEDATPAEGATVAAAADTAETTEATTEVAATAEAVETVDAAATTDAATEEAVAATAADESSPAVAVMEGGKSQTKLAQAWAAWNESTKAADQAAASKPAEPDVISRPFTLKPVVAKTAATSDDPAATSAAETAEPQSDGVAVAAGTYQPPAEEPAQPQQSSGVTGWFRRGGDKDHGQH